MARELNQGLKLLQRFFREVVQPILPEQFPDLAYAAARFGTGSEVLGKLQLIIASIATLQHIPSCTSD
jgi:hypothetical protein